jgi:serine/threonine protein kinase
VTHQPPELLLYGQMSKSADVYSFAVLVWEMCSGRRPFAGMSHSQVLHAVGLGRTLEVPPGIPPGLSSLLAACLSKEPAQR